MTLHTSVKSTALEPKAGTALTRRVLTVYGMVVLTVLIAVFFSVLRPDTFPTLLNFRLLASGKAVLLVLALAVTIPMVAGKIDLSVGYAVGLWQVLALSLQLHGLDYRLAILLVLLGGAVVGAVNALLVELAQVDAFIATLATGQVISAITYWHTGGRQITDNDGERAQAFDSLATWSLGAVPGPFVVAIVLAVALWVTLEFTPVGRYLYAVGANPKAAELIGVRRRHYVVGAMVTSGVIAGIAGVLLSSRQAGVVQANIGPEFLLPALAAAFLGSTTIRPGRVNAWGTVLGVVVTTLGISGLQQLLPGRFYLEPLFNGLTLVAAITIASLASRRRLASAERHQAIDPPVSPGDGQVPADGERQDTAGADGATEPVQHTERSTT
jgi:ribose transport system permease protein